MEKIILNANWRTVLLSFVGLLLSFGVLHYLLSSSLLDHNGIQSLAYYSKKHTVWKTINSAVFWKSSIGVPLKMGIEIVFATILLKVGIYFAQIVLSFKALMQIVIMGYVIFLIQLTGEVVYIQQFMPSSEIEHLDAFSLFSVSFLIEKLGFIVPYYLKHMFQVINLFEIGFWLLTAFSISQVGSVSFRKAFSVVGFYVFILFIWLLVVSILTLLI
ncbi:MAG: hypothetical protein Q8T08_12765 [Ignavibacteria bacterium]|nr:hypothetical protein [Ignavibacteria bacterium]